MLGWCDAEGLFGRPRARARATGVGGGGVLARALHVADGARAPLYATGIISTRRWRRSTRADVACADASSMSRLEEAARGGLARGERDLPLRGSLRGSLFEAERAARRIGWARAVRQVGIQAGQLACVVSTELGCVCVRGAQAEKVERRHVATSEPGRARPPSFPPASERPRRRIRPFPPNKTRSSRVIVRDVDLKEILPVDGGLRCLFVGSMEGG